MKIKNPFLLKLGGYLVFAFSRMWMSTLRMRAWLPDVNLDPAVLDEDPEHPRRRIYLFWHEYILYPFYLRGGCHLTMLLSQHADATILYHAAKLAGFGVVRGSSRRGATANTSSTISTPRRSGRWPSGGEPERTRMRITVTSVFVDDQDRALAFYTEKLGFVGREEGIAVHSIALLVRS